MILGLKKGNMKRNVIDFLLKSHLPHEKSATSKQEINTLKFLLLLLGCYPVLYITKWTPCNSLFLFQIIRKNSHFKLENDSPLKNNEKKNATDFLKK